MRTLITAAGLLLLATPAFAQDSDDQEFSGFYVGGSVGYGFQIGSKDETVIFDRGFDGTPDTITNTANANVFTPGFCSGRATSSANSNCDNDRKGIEYHARAGFDYQTGHVVIGLVGEIGKSDIRDSVSAFSTTPASYTLNREIDWNANVRLRLGYTVMPKTLVYATGGAAYARIKNSFETSNTQNAFLDNGKSDSWGYTFGGGVEQKLGSNFSVGVEYLYTRYNDDDYRVRATQGTASPINPFILFGSPGTEFQRSDPHFDFSAVRATATFRF